MKNRGDQGASGGKGCKGKSLSFTKGGRLAGEKKLAAAHPRRKRRRKLRGEK